jgi:hypothetical protein
MIHGNEMMIFHGIQNRGIIGFGCVMTHGDNYNQDV